MNPLTAAFIGMMLTEILLKLYVPDASPWIQIVLIFAVSCIFFNLEDEMIVGSKQ